MSKKSALDAGADPVSRFEASLKELEDIVARMERGDLPLEESLKLFERGVALSRECRSSLEKAELRVRNLLEIDSNSGDADGGEGSPPAMEDET